LTRRHPELQLRPVNRASLADDVPRIKRIYNEAWERNWGAVPLTDAEIDFLVERLQPLLVDGLVWLAESGSEPVGFLLALPDFNEALHPLRGRLLSPGLLWAPPYLFGWKRPKRIRLVALGIRREFRGRGIEAAMLGGALEASQRDGYTECEASWVLEDNTPVHRLVRVFGGQLGKIYRIFGRTSAPVFSKF
jgi:GNAT superfamily N-acetyltransferase